MATSPLPPALEARLAAVAARVRRLRVVRGASAFAVAAVLAAAFPVLLDAALTLPVVVRCLLQVLWVGAVGVLGWRLVGRPWRDDVPFDEVARRVESHYPELGERLLTLVGLRNDAGPAHGAPPLVAGLARETEERTRGLDFAAVAPGRSAVRFAAASSLLLVVTVAMIAALPGPRERLRRAWMPWHRPTAAVPFRVVVTSGNPVVRRAAAVTLTAYLERTDPAAPLPDEAVLVYRIGAGEEHRLPMAGDGAAAFHLTLPAITDDLEYRVELGSAVSPTYTVLVADPVELDDSTTTAITPPAYAAAVVPPRSSPGVSELHGLQFSTATLAFRFTRPAATAFLEWHPAGAPPGPGTLLALTLTPDRRAATATVSLAECGLLRLVLANEDGPRRVRTEVPIPVRVAVDEPPRFVQVAGASGRPRLARPTDRVFVGFAATDDVGVGAAELEYAVGPEFRPVRLPLPLSGPGTRRVEGRTLFDLAGRAAEGQTIRLRLHVTDTRKLTDPALPPQTAVYPPSGWAEFKLAASAPPLDEQEYYGQRDELNEALTAAIADVGPAAAEVEALRGETATLNPLPLDHKIRIDRVRDRLVAARDRLRSAATEAELTPDLRPLAANVSAVSEGPLRSAVEHLGRARADSPTDRVAALSAAGKELIDARSRLADLLARNGRLAQARLDRSRLETLALDQTALADRLTPEAPAAELKTAQEELRSRLRLTIGRSEPLLRGFDGAAGRDRRALAAETTALMIRVRDLDAAARAETTAARKRFLTRVGGAHAASTAEADRVFARLQLPGRLAGLVMPRHEDFRKASDLIARDSPVEALVELEKLAADFDRTADAVEKWAADRADVKAAARQLALWQDDLRSRFVDVTRGTPFARLPEPARAALRTEQQTLRDALARLRFPADVTDEKAAAVLATTRATEDVDGDGRGAVVAMKTAADALARLAERTPSVQTRLAAARVELDRIRLDEEALYNAADQAARPLAERPLDPGVLQAFAKKLEGLPTRQLSLAGRLAALDLPGLEARQARVVFVLELAAADLRDAAPFDVLASLAAARRELDRLKLALDAPPAPDDRAGELAARQAVIAKELIALGPTPPPKQLAPLAFAQREVQKAIDFLPAPEAPALLHEAREAVKAAEFREGTRPEELQRRTATAAAALRRLAGRMTGAESDVDRVRRLSVNRAAAAEEARKLAGTRFNPDASGEAKRQLGREADELTHSRVGFVNQSLKRDVLRLYADLQRQTEPDRQYANQKALSEGLGTLAARMADVESLAFPRPPDPPPLEAYPEDAYLPSRALAADLRAVAARQRTVRDRLNALPADLANDLKPAATRRAPLEAELATAAAAHAARLDAATADLPAGDEAAKDFSAAAERVRVASELLAEAADKDRSGLATEADKARAEAHGQLILAEERTARAAGPPPKDATDPATAAAGDALYEAELAMRRAERALPGDPAAAVREMKRAAAALDRAAHATAGLRP